MDIEINFICPICNQEVTEEEADNENVTLDADTQQMYHVSCLNKHENEK